MPSADRHIRLAFEQVGEGGPVLFFVHGFACNRNDWECQVAHFKDKYTCISVDLRAHGESAGSAEDDFTLEKLAADAIHVLEEHAEGPVVLIGHSMGCRVIMEMYRQIPDRVSHLILVEGSKMGEGDPEEVRKQMLAIIDSPEYGNRMLQVFKEMLSAITSEDIKKRILANTASIPRGIGKKLGPNMAVWDAVVFQELIKKISVPVLLVQSTYISPDRVRTPLNEGDSSPFIEWFENHISRLQVDIIAGTGHFPMLEKPKEVNQSIESFLKEYNRTV